MPETARQKPRSATREQPRLPGQRADGLEVIESGALTDREFNLVLATMFAHAAIGMAYISLDGEYLRVNEAMCALAGVSESELVGMNIRDLTHPDDAEVDSQLLGQLKAGTDTSVEYDKRYLRPDGTTRWVHVIGTVHLREGVPAGMFGQAADVTARKERLAKAKAQAARDAQLRDFLRDLNQAGADFGKVIEAATGLVASGFSELCSVFLALDDEFHLDLVGLEHRDQHIARELRKIITASPYRRDEALGSAAITTGIPVIYSSLSSEQLSAMMREDFRSLISDDPITSLAVVPLLVRGNPIGVLTLGRRNGSDAFIDDDLALLTEIAQRLASAIETARLNAQRIEAELALRESQRQLLRSNTNLQRLATHDSLTGLPNRMLLMDRLCHGLTQLTRSQRALAVLYIDLDNFKSINDTFGHGVGDALLVEVAAALAGAVRPADTVARIGGDEFVVICNDVIRLDDVTTIAERIADVLSQPFAVDLNRLMVAASIGYVVTRDNEADADALIHRADLAMFESKKAGVPIQG